MSSEKLTMGLLAALGLCLAPLACDAGSSTSGSAEGGTAITTTGNDGTGDSGTDGSGGTDTNVDGSDGTDTNATETSGQIDIEPANVIDDLEDGDPLILAANGRQGAWYTYNDETEGAVQDPPAPFVPSEGGPDGSLYQGLTSGSGFTTWGAGLGVDLNNAGDPDGGDGMRMPWDASAHQGIVFHARGNTPIRVKLLVDAIVPAETGGSCMADCEDAHGKIVPLTDDWQQYTVAFDEAFQEGWGAAAAFDASTLMSVQFQVGADAEFEYAIDNVGFY